MGIREDIVRDYGNQEKDVFFRDRLMMPTTGAPAVSTGVTLGKLREEKEAKIQEKYALPPGAVWEGLANRVRAERLKEEKRKKRIMREKIAHGRTLPQTRRVGDDPEERRLNAKYLASDRRIEKLKEKELELHVEGIRVSKVYEHKDSWHGFGIAAFQSKGLKFRIKALEAKRKYDRARGLRAGERGGYLLTDEVAKARKEFEDADRVAYPGKWFDKDVSKAYEEKVDPILQPIALAVMLFYAGRVGWEGIKSVRDYYNYVKLGKSVMKLSRPERKVLINEVRKGLELAKSEGIKLEQAPEALKKPYMDLIRGRSVEVIRTKPIFRKLDRFFKTAKIPEAISERKSLLEVFGGGPPTKEVGRALEKIPPVKPETIPGVVAGVGARFNNITIDRVDKKLIPTFDVTKPDSPLYKSTVTAEQLKKEGIPIPAIPEGEMERAKKTLVAVEPRPSTQAQKARAHILAKERKLIITTKAGNISTMRYKRLAKGMTGKTSIAKMTEDEAEDFIKAIDVVVQRRPWEPPIIPMSEKIVPKEFFEMRFKEPGIAKPVTPKQVYLRVLGAEPIVEPLTKAFSEYTFKQQEVNKWVNNVERTINKLGKTTLKQRAVSKILNKPTPAVARFRDLLDKYETAPEFMGGKEAKVFNEIRTFTKNMLKNANIMREKVGLEPIKEIKEYIPHFLDELSRQIVQKKYPFPEDVKYWLGRKIPAKVYNPTAMQRQVRKEMEDFFSKDLGALLRTLAKYDLRDIYLSEPYSTVRTQLNALGDKIPANTRRVIDEYIRHDIFNYPVQLDQMLNKTLEKPTQLVNHFLKPLGRVITNPIASMSRITRRGIMGATIAAKPKLPLRNIITQKFLTINLYPIRSLVKAQFLPTPKGQMEKIRATNFYKHSVKNFEDLPKGFRPIDWGLYPYSKSHAGINYVSNVDVAMKTANNAAMELVKWSKDKNSLYYKWAVKKSAKTGEPISKFLWTEEDAMKETIEGGKTTQWLYFATGMPNVFRGQAARMGLALQSWWMNLFFNHYRETACRTFTGKTSWGKYIPPSWRLNWIKGTAVIYGVFEGLRKTTGLDYKRFIFLWGPAPTYLSPPGQIVLGTYKYITAKTDWERKKAANQIKYSYKAFIPGSGAWKDLTAFMKGEKSLKETLFYTERKKKKKTRYIKTKTKSGVGVKEVPIKDISIRDTIIKDYGER